MNREPYRALLRQLDAAIRAGKRDPDTGGLTLSSRDVAKLIEAVADLMPGGRPL